MNIKISIIVPVFNTQKYLCDCLDSLVSQTLREIEIIIIDDASTDFSPMIIEGYRKKYPNKIKAYRLPENSRQGTARNLGIRKAMGEFIMFVDSDDVIDIHSCEKMYKKALETHSDIVFCDYEIFGDNIESEYQEHISKVLIHELGIDKKKALLTTSVVPWAKIIKRKIVINNKITFPEHSYFEDQATTYLFYLYARKVDKVDEPLYRYRKSINSTTSNIEMEKIKQRTKMGIELIERIKAIDSSESYKEELEMFAFEQIFILGIITCVDNGEINKQIIDYLLSAVKNYCKNIYNNPYYNSIVSEQYKKIWEYGNFSSDILLQMILSRKIMSFCPNYAYQITNSENKIKILVNYLDKTKWRVAFWGAGKYGYNIFSFLKECGINFVAVIDKNECLQGKMFDDTTKIYFTNYTSFIDLVILPYTGWKYAVKEIINDQKSNVHILDLEIFLKYNLKVNLDDYWE